jgi:hypothetical protein
VVLHLRPPPALRYVEGLGDGGVRDQGVGPFRGSRRTYVGFPQASERLKVVRAVEPHIPAAATNDRNFRAGTTYVPLVEDWLRHEWVPEVHGVIGGPTFQGFLGGNVRG